MPQIEDTLIPNFDEGLRCPQCEYNLTGLVDDVCPECGGAFDRDVLIAELAGAPQPIPIWGTRGDCGSPAAFICTLWEIWIHPVRFAHRFPKNPQVRAPVVFARWCLLIAMTVCLLPALIINVYVLEATFYIASTILIAVQLSERLIAGTVFIPITQLSWDEDWYRRGLALTRMTRAFLVLSSVCTSAGFLLDFWNEDRIASRQYTLWSSMIAFGYWYFSLLCIATTYRRSAMTFFITLLAVPIVTVGSVFAGSFCAGLIGNFLF